MDKETNQVATWVKASHGDAPANTLIGGQDAKGEPIYVARANFHGDLIPGKLVSSDKAAHVSLYGFEGRVEEYEVLVHSTGKWKVTNENNIPDNALVGGSTRDGEIVYVGRVRHQNSITTGKVLKSAGLCSIPFDGKEMTFKGYEILLKND